MNSSNVSFPVAALLVALAGGGVSHTSAAEVKPVAPFLITTPERVTQATPAWTGERTPDGRPVLPPTILTEAVAQVGAILVLAKPENRQRIPFFAGIERVRYRRPVYPGDVVVIEANVVRLRTRMGLLKGVARVNGERVIDGTMTFALGDPLPK